jgi:hypothetical protein
MLLSDEQRFLIVLSSIRDYKAGENDLGILIVEKVTNEILNCVDNQITTQEIFDDIIETFNYYNDFVKEKNIDLKPIPEEMGILVEYYMNEVVNNVRSMEK